MVVERVELVGGTHPARCARQCQCDILSHHYILCQCDILSQVRVELAGGTRPGRCAPWGSDRGECMWAGPTQIYKKIDSTWSCVPGCLNLATLLL